MFYKLNPQLRNLNTDFTLNNFLSGSVKLSKNADLDKYKYSGYGIGLGSRSEFFLDRSKLWKTCRYFWSWYELFVHFDNKNKDNLIFGEGPTQGLDGTKLTVESY